MGNGAQGESNIIGLKHQSLRLPEWLEIEGVSSRQQGVTERIWAKSPWLIREVQIKGNNQRILFQGSLLAEAKSPSYSHFITLSAKL